MDSSCANNSFNIGLSLLQAVLKRLLFAIQKLVKRYMDALKGVSVDDEIIP